MDCNLTIIIFSTPYRNVINMFPKIQLNLLVVNVCNIRKRMISFEESEVRRQLEHSSRCGSLICYIHLLCSSELLLNAYFVMQNIAYVKIIKPVIEDNEIKARNYILILSYCLISHTV
jgi:hypothetical protein